METNTLAKNTVRVERIFDADVKLMWRTWTEPELIKLWFGSDPDGTVEEVEMDLRIGGAYRVSFTDSDASRHACKGRILTIIEHELLVWSWEWESEPGYVSQLKVTFHPLGEKTNVVLEHSNLNPESRHVYDKGWNGGLDKIEKILPNLTIKPNPNGPSK